MSTLNEQTKKAYDDLRQDYSKDELSLYCGGFEGLRDIIKEGGLNDFCKWLTAPTPDWQCDC